MSLTEPQAADSPTGGAALRYQGDARGAGVKVAMRLFAFRNCRVVSER
ncbi:MAG: hypothetical protein KME26_28850 [Oscillatoria princeps RMCB-10]|nr:hypothetical protein [Oscillatoria princeps RMCB-10]